MRLEKHMNTDGFLLFKHYAVHKLHSGDRLMVAKQQYLCDEARGVLSPENFGWDINNVLFKCHYTYIYSISCIYLDIIYISIYIFTYLSITTGFFALIHHGALMNNGNG